jgi:hypothetical protein
VKQIFVPHRGKTFYFMPRVPLGGPSRGFSDGILKTLSGRKHKKRPPGNPEGRTIYAVNFKKFSAQPTPNSERAITPSCFSTCGVMLVNSMETW